MHCMHCGMPKGTSQAEVTSNSEKIKSVALAATELRFSEGNSQSVSRKFHYIKNTKFLQLQYFASISGCTECIFGLGYT